MTSTMTIAKNDKEAEMKGVYEERAKKEVIAKFNRECREVWIDYCNVRYGKFSFLKKYIGLTLFFNFDDYIECVLSNRGMDLNRYPNHPLFKRWNIESKIGIIGSMKNVYVTDPDNGLVVHVY